MTQLIQNIMKRTVLVFIILLAAGLFLFPEISKSGVATGLQVCAKSILPSLFPFFVITELCAALGYTQKITAALSSLANKIFHIPQSAVTLTFGFIGGYPVGARTVLQQYEAGEISKNDAQRLLLYCNNAGPAFIIGIAGSAILKSTKAGLILYLIHILSACILGVFFRPPMPADAQTNKNSHPGNSFAEAFTGAVKNSGQTIIHICVFIIFFSVMSAYLKAFLPKQIQNHFFVTFLLASLELAGGLHSLTTVSNSAVLFCIISFMLGWGGFCVYFQTQTLLDHSDLSSKGYLCSKLFHGLLSMLLSASVAPFLYPPEKVSFATSLPTSYTAVIPFLAVAAVIICIFLKKSSGKQKNNAV